MKIALRRANERRLSVVKHNNSKPVFIRPAGCLEKTL